jgi:hypothetical protein
MNQSYTNPTKRPSIDSVEKFYSRLHATLTTLQKLEERLPPETWARFARAYSSHWLYSLDHGETAAAPDDFYRDWASIEELGAIPIAGNDDLHVIRKYGVYESPREKARNALGLEAAK